MTTPAALRTRIITTALKRVPVAEITTPDDDARPTYITPQVGTHSLPAITATLDAFGWTYTVLRDGVVAVPNGQFA